LELLGEASSQLRRQPLGLGKRGRSSAAGGLYPDPGDPGARLRARNLKFFGDPSALSFLDSLPFAEEISQELISLLLAG
jgi:hypothetical protein